jgi:RHS repeat-associated protein
LNHSRLIFLAALTVASCLVCAPAHGRAITAEQKTALWGFENQPSGSKLHEAAQSPDFAKENEGYSYESAMGRAYWLSRDPIGERGGINLYGMVGNDAVNRWDLLGMAPNSITTTEVGRQIGKCGAFALAFKFELDKPADNNGQIVQQVVLHEKFYNCDGTIKTDEITNFFETIVVQKGDKTSPITKALQQAGQPAYSDINQHVTCGGRGEITVDMSLSWIDDANYGYGGMLPPQQPGQPPVYAPVTQPGWGYGDQTPNGPPSGSLPSSWDMPPGSGGFLGGRTINASWDCCKGEQDTKLSVSNQ